MFVRSQRFRWAALALGLAVGAAACGSGGSQPAATPVSITAIGDANGAPPAKQAPSAPSTSSVEAATTTTAPGVATASTVRPKAVVRIMPLGDSLTQGDDPNDPTSPQTYRGALAAQIAAAGYAVDFVGSDTTPVAGGGDADNEGHGGYTIGPDASRFCATCDTANLADHVEGWLAAAQPDVVLLMAGANDLLPEPTPTADGLVRPVQPSEAGAKLGALVAQIRAAAPSTTVLVASQPPMSFYAGNPATQAAFQDLNAAASGLDDPAAGIYYVPMQEQLALTWDYANDSLADRLHPSASGATKVAGVWMSALIPVLDQFQPA